MVAKTQSKVDQFITKQYLRGLLSERSRIVAGDDNANELRAYLDSEIKHTRAFLEANKGALPIVKKGTKRVPVLD